MRKISCFVSIEVSLNIFYAFVIIMDAFESGNHLYGKILLHFFVFCDVDIFKIFIFLLFVMWINSKNLINPGKKKKNLGAITPGWKFLSHKKVHAACLTNEAPSMSCLVHAYQTLQLAY